MWLIVLEISNFLDSDKLFKVILGILNDFDITEDNLIVFLISGIFIKLLDSFKKLINSFFISVNLPNSGVLTIFKFSLNLSAFSESLF